MSPDPFDAEATLKAAILDGLAAGETAEAQRDAIYAAVLAEPVRWAILSLVIDDRIEFMPVDGGVLEPRGYCEHCRRLVGVTDRQGIGLADRAAWQDSRSKGLGAYLVPHDQLGTSARCPGGGKRIHS